MPEPAHLLRRLRLEAGPSSHPVVDVLRLEEVGPYRPRHLAVPTSPRADDPRPGPVRRRTGTATAALRTLVAARTASSPDDVSIARSCRSCGATDHGAPVLLTADGTPPPLHLSVSYAHGCVLVAVTDAGPLGIDVETVGGVGFDGFDETALDPRERLVVDLLPEGERPRWRARRWAAKEALLKSTRRGLTVDPSRLVLDGTSVLVWPPELVGDLPPGARAHVVPVPAGTERVGCIAVLAPRRPLLRLHVAVSAPSALDTRSLVPAHG